MHLSKSPLVTTSGSGPPGWWWEPRDGGCRSRTCPPGRVHHPSALLAITPGKAQTWDLWGWVPGESMLGNQGWEARFEKVDGPGGGPGEKLTLV